MSSIKVRGQTIDVDIEEELRHYEWERPRWSSAKLICASPFRYDRTPSFFVSLDGDYAGCWSDSGAYDSEWASGNLAKLLAFLRNETYEESEEYLLETYGITYHPGVQLMLKPAKLKLPQRKAHPLSLALLSPYSAGPCEYLRGRGISDEAQQQADICFDTARKAVVIPWHSPNGDLANVKYRSTYSKVFWYAKDAAPIRSLIYGIERVNGPIAVLEEAEIDALSWTTIGVNGIAAGGANFTDAQADIIKRSPIKTLYISGDNDKAGSKFSKQIADKLRGYVELRMIRKPDGVKDTNEALQKGVKLPELLEKSKRVETLSTNTLHIGKF